MLPAQARCFIFVDKPKYLNKLITHMKWYLTVQIVNHSRVEFNWYMCH